MHNGRRSRIKYYLLPVVAACGIIPLIMRVHLYNNDAFTGYPWFSQADYNAMDVFLWVKSIAIQVLGLIILILLIDRVVIQGRRLVWKKSFSLPAVYLVFVIVSGLVSDNRSLVFRGAYERFEPIGVIISYLLIFYYSYLCVETEEDLTTLINCLGLCLIPMLLLGVLQSLGIDPFAWDTIKRLLLPAYLKDNADNLVITRDKGIAYLTLYNENYPGMYFGILIPLFIALFIASNKPTVRIVSGIYTLLSFFILFHASSHSGWIALIVSAFVIMWIIMSRSRRGLISYIVITGLLCISICAAVFIFPAVRERLNMIFHEGREEVHKVTAIETGENEIVFYYVLGNELHASFDFAENGSFLPSFIDKNGKELLYSVNDDAYVLDECFAYADARVTLQEIDGMDVVVFATDGHEWPMVKDVNGSYYYLNSALRLDRIRRPESAGMFSPSFLSGRGRIWNGCIPLMLNHVFTGTGANTFMTAFPQDDYVAMNYRLGWRSYEYDVKAHSFFINDSIENGMIADLCLIIFFITYLIKGAVIYRKADISGTHMGYNTALAGLGLYAGCLTYMITALVNDSNVCVAPVFWAVLGISMSVNGFVKSIQNHI